MLRKTFEKISIENFDLDIVFDSKEQASIPGKAEYGRMKKKPSGRTGKAGNSSKKQTVKNKTKEII